MADIFYSSKYSIEHAKRHIHNLETEVAVFFKTDPYARVVETSPDGTQDAHKVKLVKPMPVALAGIAFDAVNSLRSALDQAGFAIARARGKSGKHAHFPFGDTSAEVESRREKQAKDLPKEIFDVMASFKPYKGVNDLIWAMNKLCNSHKHEIIVPVYMVTGGGLVKNAEFPVLLSFNFPPRWDATKNEMVLAVVPHGTACNINLQVAMFVAFTDVDPIARQPAVPILYQMTRMIEGIVMGLEAEATRLGIIK